MRRWISPKELFSEFEIAISTQAKLRMKGKIPHSKVGKFIFYDRVKIDAWLENHAVFHKDGIKNDVK